VPFYVILENAKILFKKSFNLQERQIKTVDLIVFNCLGAFVNLKHLVIDL